MSHIAEAAEAIHALINSTPRTPSQAEIAAVIDKALTTPSAARGATRSMTRSTTTSPTSRMQYVRS